MGSKIGLDGRPVDGRKAPPPDVGAFHGGAPARQRSASLESPPAGAHRDGGRGIGGDSRSRRGREAQWSGVPSSRAGHHDLFGRRRHRTSNVLADDHSKFLPYYRTFG